MSMVGYGLAPAAVRMSLKDVVLSEIVHPGKDHTVFLLVCGSKNQSRQEWDFWVLRAGRNKEFAMDVALCYKIRMLEREGGDDDGMEMRTCLKPLTIIGLIDLVPLRS